MLSDVLKSYQIPSDAPGCSQILSDPLRCFNMLSHALRCYQILSDSLRCSLALSDALGCSQKLSDALKFFRCSRILSIALKNFQMLSDALKCFQMLSDALKCSQMFPKSIKRLRCKPAPLQFSLKLIREMRFEFQTRPNKLNQTNLQISGPRTCICVCMYPSRVVMQFSSLGTRTISASTANNGTYTPTHKHVVTTGAARYSGYLVSAVVCG